MRGYVLEFDGEYPKPLPDLHNDYPIATDKIEIEIEMLLNYQLKVALIIFLLVILKNWCLTSLFKKIYVLHHESFQLYLRMKLKLKIASCIRTQSITMAKTICTMCKCDTQQRIEAKKGKKGEKDGEQCFVW